MERKMNYPCVCTGDECKLLNVIYNGSFSNGKVTDIPNGV
jgi:hypothetical protein